MGNSLLAKHKNHKDGVENERLDVSDPTQWRVSTNEEEAALDATLELQMISIRLQKSIVEKLKHIATDKGTKYQPLVRMILTQFVKDQEPKRQS